MRCPGLISMTILMPVVIACSASQNRVSSDNYARIAVLNYANRSESVNFDYLSASLGDATREAMRTRFEYRGIDGGNPALSDEETLAAMTGNADVLILGEYRKAATKTTKGKADTLIISGKIYALRSRKIIAEYSRTAAADARIFTTVNEIAEQAVESIRTYVHKINEGSAAPIIDGKEALTVERLKLKVFVPPMF